MHAWVYVVQQVPLDKKTTLPCHTDKKALLGFEPRISCLLDRRFNQLSHKAKYDGQSSRQKQNFNTILLILRRRGK